MAADGETLETATLLFEFMGQPLADGETIFGQANGRGHDIGELHGAIGFQSQREAGDHAMAGTNSLCRPTLGVAVAVAEFCRSLAANQRRCQANDENTQKDGLSYAHAGSKTLSDSQDTVKASCRGFAPEEK